MPGGPRILTRCHQLVAYLAQQAPAAPARRRPHTTGTAAPLRLVRRVPGVEQFLLVDDVVAVEDGTALVPGQEHGDALGDAGADQVTGGGAAAIVDDDQADRMIGLIADLLDAGRIEAGTLSVAPEPSEVAALVDQARGTFISGGGRHAVGIDLPPDLPPVLADRQRIVQVLNNLLANAARHAPDTAAIRIAAERDGEHVAVSVSDEGRGIAPERLGQLFRKYAAAGDREGGVGGGLGLAICKGLVEAHGGRIRAESGGVGLGTRVTFTIPAAGPADAGARPRRPGWRAAAADAVPILVVDDDPGTLRHVRDTLADAGYAPLVTGDPREAVAPPPGGAAPAGAARLDAAREPTGSS